MGHIKGGRYLAGFAKRTLHKFRRSSERLPKQTNVHVTPSDVSYPTIASIVQDMEARRDLSESLVKSKILDMELKLLKAENSMAREALNVAIQQALAQSAPAMTHA